MATESLQESIKNVEQAGGIVIMPMEITETTKTDEEIRAEEKAKRKEMIKRTRISASAAMRLHDYDPKMLYDTSFMMDSVLPACCSECCEVEPDGYCEHGNPSVLHAILGFV